MDTTDFRTPITSSDWDDIHLGIKESTFDGNLDFFCNFDSDTAVSRFVSCSNDSLESGSLTGLSLFLDRQNAHNLIEEFIWVGFLFLCVEKFVNDLGFLDWNRMGVNFFDRLDVVSFNQSAEFSQRHPAVTFVSSAAETASASSAATSATSAKTKSSTISTASSSVSAAASGAVWCSTSWWCVSCWRSLGWCLSLHFCL